MANTYNFLPINELMILSTILFMHKLKYRQQLLKLFFSLFQCNNQIHQISTRSSNAFHWPYYSKTV